MLASVLLLTQTRGKDRPMKNPTFYRAAQIDGLSIFYQRRADASPAARIAFFVTDV
jgi:hypothetical protein